MGNFLRAVIHSAKVSRVRAKIRKKKAELKSLGREYRGAVKVESKKLSRKLAKRNKKKKR